MYALGVGLRAAGQIYSTSTHLEALENHRQLATPAKHAGRRVH